MTNVAALERTFERTFEPANRAGMARGEPPRQRDGRAGGYFRQTGCTLTPS